MFINRKLKVIVTGFPRSGTSFSTGLIAKLGFSPGKEDKMRPADEYNKYGYFENQALMNIDHNILKKFGGSAFDPPELAKNWVQLCSTEIREIKHAINKHKIDLYKGNMLVMTSEIYAHIYPEAKWIFIRRSKDKILESIRRSTPKTLSENFLEDVFNKWVNAWEKSPVSKGAYTVCYDNFFKSPETELRNLSKFLDVKLTENALKDSLNFFRP